MSNPTISQVKDFLDDLPEGAQVTVTATLPSSGETRQIILQWDGDISWAVERVALAQEQRLALAERVLAALRAETLGDDRKAVLGVLLASQQGAWVPLDTLAAAIEQLGRGKGDKARWVAQQALRYIDWQLRKHLSETDMAGSAKPNALLVDMHRTRTTPTEYRLTPLGRLVLSVVLGKT